MDVIRICILVGSARTGGNSIGIATWVNGVLDELLHDSSHGITNYNVTVIDPHTKPHPIHPVLDETIPALRHDSMSYSSQEVREWSEFIKSCSALVVVTPQHNWGYPSTLKAAIDVLYHEWRAKPVAVVTLGGHGGSKCDEQLRQVMASVKMDVVEQRVQITLPEQYIRGNERVKPSEERDTFLAEYKDSLQIALKQLVGKIGQNRKSERDTE